MKSFDLAGKINYNGTSDRFSSFRLNSPISLCYQVTTRCNYSCPHCLSSSGPKGDNGLSTDDSIKLIDLICDSGVKRINMTGGEPLLRKDLPILCRRAKEKGADVVITTNGSFTSPRLLEALSGIIDFVQISIDGRETVNDQLRHPGSFKRAVAAIGAYQRSGIEVRINCTLQRQNVDETDHIVDLAKYLGVNSLYFIILCAQGRAAERREFFCFEEELEKKINDRLKALATQQSIDVKILDFRRYERSCVLVSPLGQLISQGWSDDDCIYTGNLLQLGMGKCWNHPGAFDHLLHLVKNVRHPLLYN